MAIFKIPLSVDQNYEQFTALSGKEYTLRVQKNNRGGFWALSIMASDGTPLVMGVAMLLGADILRRFRYVDGLPPGVLFMFDLTQAGLEAGDSDVGTRVVLAYDDGEA